jgi:pimeloyl-ACP methyl ester carboxylesterase
MRKPLPFFREVGSGPGVICLHASASHSGQWRSLMERLGTTFHVLAADSYGAGKSPAWIGDRTLSLSDEVAFLEPVFARAGETFTLVGHSYGAAIALVAAIAMPARVRALALYEPVLFSLLDAESPPPNEADGISEVVASAVAAIAAGNPRAAAECFIDYWMGFGAWASMPEERREPITKSIVNIQASANALFREPTPLSVFKALHVPVLYMTGTESPASSRGVARVLAKALPRVTLVEFEGVGHMGPVTHPEIVNEVIADFVQSAAEASANARPRRQEHGNAAPIFAAA